MRTGVMEEITRVHGQEARSEKHITTGAGAFRAVAPGASPTESPIWSKVYFALASGLLALALVIALRPLVVPLAPNGDHYVYLARHLAAGNLNVDDLPAGYADYVEWAGHKYLPFGLLPAVVLLPFLPLFNAGMGLVSIGILFTGLNIFLFSGLLRQVGVTGDRLKWALLLFFGGTAYFGVAIVGSGANSWGFAHILAITCMLAAVSELLENRHAALAGLFLGLAAMTRMTTLFALPLFVWMLWSRAATGPKSIVRLGRLWAFILGLAAPVAAIFLYNYLRFGNPLESGYALALLYEPTLAEARNYGLFSPVHIPKNLFMMLLQGPLPYPSENAPVLQFPYLKPSEWGMGLFFTSPALLYAFRARLREPLVQACWLGIISVMVPTITYYGIGWRQFGFRYALDFLPFVLLLAARGFPDPLPNRVRALVVFSVAVSIWGILALSNGL
jgi:hypothetical protein